MGHTGLSIASGPDLTVLSMRSGIDPAAASREMLRLVGGKIASRNQVVSERRNFLVRVEARAAGDQMFVRESAIMLDRLVPEGFSRRAIAVAVSELPKD